MTLNDYQVKALETAQFPLGLIDSMTSVGIVVQRPAKWVYPVLGLTGEAGEVSDKFKKIMRDKHGVIDDADKEDIKKELGDVLWYVAIIADILGIKLEDVAVTNTVKLKSRKERGKISGNGDNR